ncbi:MAG: sporulation protein YqfD [Clostridia bacterium]|nr:sporulation protein YqfD [Clostridia bacterium]
MRRVTYRVSCRRSAFLLNRLLSAGLLLTDIEREQEKLCFSVSYEESARADALLSEYGFEYRKGGYLGAKALTLKVLSRPFLLSSILIAVVLVILSQSFVYSYSVSGNRLVNTSTVEDILREKGIAGIVSKRAIDTSELKRAVSSLDGVSFASVRLEGNRLLVEIKEELPRETPDEVYYSPVTSLSHAVVTRIVAETGTPAVRSGDIVSPGDELISPTYTFTEGEAPAPARGEVWGLVTYEKEVILPLFTIESVRTGEVFTSRSISLFGREGGSALPPFSEYDIEERVVYRGIGVTVTEKTYRRRAAVTVCHDFDRELSSLTDAALSELLLSVPFHAGERGRVEVTQKKLDNVLYIVLYYTVEQRIDSSFAS